MEEEYPDFDDRLPFNDLHLHGFWYSPGIRDSRKTTRDFRGQCQLLNVRSGIWLHFIGPRSYIVRFERL